MNYNFTLIFGIIAVGLSFYAGHHVASGECAALETKAAAIALEKYHATEQKLNDTSALLEQSRAANAAHAKTIARQVQAIKSRPLYAGTCIDADGLRIINDALRSPTDPTEPAH